MTKTKLGQRLYGILFVASILIYLFAPLSYDYIFCIVCCIGYVVTIIAYCKLTKKKNYMDFDTMFFISFFFVCFFYPIFIYPLDPTRFWIFNYKFNENIISKSTALSLLAAVSYMYGGVLYTTSKREQISQRSNYKLRNLINTSWIFIISLLSFGLYIALGGYASLVGMYAGEGKDMGGLYSYFYILSYVCIFCMIIVWLYNSYMISPEKIRWGCIPKVQALYIVVFVLLHMIAGSRGKILNIALISLGLYAYLYRPFSLKNVFAISVLGIVVMCGIGIYRSGGQYNVSSIADLGMDLILTNRNTFEAIDLVDENGVTYGSSMLAYVLGIVPLLQGVVFSTFNIDPDTASSAMLITDSIIGTTDSVGTGTSIVADIYLAFGSFGVIVMMFFLGRCMRYLTFKARENIYELTVYAIMIGVAVYLPRAEFFYPARLIVWCVVVIYFAIHLKCGLRSKVC